MTPCPTHRPPAPGGSCWPSRRSCSRRAAPATSAQRDGPAWPWTTTWSTWETVTAASSRWMPPTAASSGATRTRTTPTSGWEGSMDSPWWPRTGAPSTSQATRAGATGAAHPAGAATSRAAGCTPSESPRRTGGAPLTSSGASPASTKSQWGPLWAAPSFRMARSSSAPRTAPFTPSRRRMVSSGGPSPRARRCGRPPRSRTASSTSGRWTTRSTRWTWKAVRRRGASLPAEA